MSVQYGAITWNRQKKVYDVTLVSLLVLYLVVFVGVGIWRNPSATAETLLIRAFGTAAFLLLNVVLCIGPLSRLDRRFLPLLYNRRHLGVTTFLLGLAHGGFALFQFHALGNVNPLVSPFISNPRYGSVADFPANRATRQILALSPGRARKTWGRRPRGRLHRCDRYRAHNSRGASRPGKCDGHRRNRRQQVLPGRDESRPREGSP